MTRLVLLMFAWLVVTSAYGTVTSTVIAQGAPDGKVPGWTIRTQSPAGWTGDCCQYAKAIGVNLVLYKGDWTGEPERVMVLNVWPATLPSLDDEWKGDQKHYLQRDPSAKIVSLPLPSTKMACRGFVYRGSDHINDAEVFCDPGKHSGIRLSWSMSFDANDTSRDQLLSLFTQVVAGSIWHAGNDRKP